MPTTSHPEIAWHWKAFDQLNVPELYALMKLRVDVFVVEQHCPYPELDDRDQGAMHLLGWAGDRLVGYLRVLPPELSGHGLPALGRIVTAADCRSLGLGRALVRLGVDYAQQAYPAMALRIAAQAHLQPFYAEFGFEPVGESYLEDDIPHIDMLLPGPSAA